jgi:hemerythrin-like metal-binding protein
MVEYIDYHFGTEETYMSRFRYEDLEPHRNEHRIFIRKVFDFRKQFSMDSQLLSKEMLTFLTDWLCHHIRETDKKYTPCFIKNGLS